MSGEFNNYCQLNNIKSKFNYDKIGGTDNEPIWKISLFIDNAFIDSIEEKSKKNGKEYLINQFMKNKDDDKKDIEIKYDFDKFSSIELDNYNKIILIDADNTVKLEKFNSNILYIFFSAKNAIKDRILIWKMNNPNVKYIITPSTISDATDHYMSFYLGWISNKLENKQLYILTKDHFGEALEKFIPNCKHIANEFELN
jgi:hypothetical protein